MLSIKKVKEYVDNQLKAYKVKDITKDYSDAEWRELYDQIVKPKAWEIERRLIDYATTELTKYKGAKHREMFYFELLVELACEQNLRHVDSFNRELANVRRTKNSIQSS